MIIKKVPTIQGVYFIPPPHVSTKMKTTKQPTTAVVKARI